MSRGDRNVNPLRLRQGSRGLRGYSRSRGKACWSLLPPDSGYSGSASYCGFGDRGARRRVSHHRRGGQRPGGRPTRAIPVSCAIRHMPASFDGHVTRRSIREGCRFWLAVLV